MRTAIIQNIMELLLAVSLLPSLCPADPQKSIVRVGVLAPLTGIRADAGEYAMNALRLAEEDLAANAASRWRLTLVVEDTQYSPRLALSALQKLRDRDQASFLIGVLNSSEVLAVAPIIEKHAMIFITPSAQAAEISDAGQNIFRLMHNTAQEAPRFARYIAAHMRGSQLDFLMMQTDAAPSYLMNFRAAFSAAGKTIGRVEEFSPDTTEFRPQLLRLAQQGCTDLFLGVTPKHSGLILKQAAELGVRPKYYGYGVEGPELIAIAGTQAEGFLYPYSFDAQSKEPSVRAFVDRYRTRYGVVPDAIAANSYDALMLLAACLERGAAQPEAVRGCLYATRDYPGAGGRFSIDARGDAQRVLLVKTVDKGALKVLATLADSAPISGKELWEQRCSPCHSLNPPPKLAPPVRGIVMNYRSRYPDRESFAAAVSAWAHDPSLERSLMPQARQRFGPMPPLPYAKDELRAIAGWMWDQAYGTLPPQGQGCGDPACGPGVSGACDGSSPASSPAS